MSHKSLLFLTENGLYCEAGDFYIDPLRAVNRAVITHAHSDHARPGSKNYLCAEPGLLVLRMRLGKNAHIETLPYRASLMIGNVKISFFPAGHILGSAQVLVEYKGEVWLVTGDYKRESDPTCANFEPVKCHTIITESTFGLPIYDWQSSTQIYTEINQWWAGNASDHKNSVIFAYSLGKAQRILAGLNSEIGNIYVDDSIETLNLAYTTSGIILPACENFKTDIKRGCICILPPSANYSELLQKSGNISTAFASGWMAVRNFRRKNNTDTGFILSDHADWKGILSTLQESGAEKVLVTHGFTQVLTRYLNEKGIEAHELKYNT